VEYSLAEGLEMAMNKFNTVRPVEEDNSDAV